MPGDHGEFAYSTSREVDVSFFSSSAICQLRWATERRDDMIIERLKAAAFRFWWWIRLIRFILISSASHWWFATRWLRKLFLSQPLVSMLLSNRYLRKSEWKFPVFPADQITDHPERFLVSCKNDSYTFFIWLAKRHSSFCRVVVDLWSVSESPDKRSISATIMQEPRCFKRGLSSEGAPCSLVLGPWLVVISKLHARM